MELQFNEQYMGYPGRNDGRVVMQSDGQTDGNRNAGKAV